MTTKNNIGFNKVIANKHLSGLDGRRAMSVSAVIANRAEQEYCRYKVRVVDGFYRGQLKFLYADRCYRPD